MSVIVPSRESEMFLKLLDIGYFNTTIFINAYLITPKF